MSTNQPPARASVQVTAPAPVQDPPVLRRQRRPGRIGGVSIIQILVVEGVLVAVAAAFFHYPIVGLAALLLGVLLLVVSFGRSRGRWWTETLMLRWQLRRRRRIPVVPDGDLRLTTLRHLIPDLVVHEHQIPGGERVGVGQDGAGWFAVTAVLPSAGLRGDERPPIPYDALARELADIGQPGTTLQVVTHTVPAAATTRQGLTYAESYRELLGSVGIAPPQEQTFWIAVRADMRSVASGTAAGEDMAALLSTAARRAMKLLRRQGLRAALLDRDGVLDALGTSCGVSGHRPGQSEIRERWAAWHADALAHACFWVRTWPAPAGGGMLLERLAAVPAQFTSVSVTLEPREAEVGMRCLVRVVAPPEALEASCLALQASARQGGATLFRLDGEHAPAVYASAPGGGGVS